MGFDLGKVFAAVNPVVALGTLGQSAADLYNAKKDREAQRDANETNVNLSNAQMAFQERLSSTAHQREVEDLRAAGINPVLSANSGASTPSGSLASVNPLPSPTRGLNFQTADMIRLSQDIRESNSRIELNQANASAVRGGAGSRFFGTRPGEMFQNLFSRIAQSAKSDIQTMPRSRVEFMNKFNRSPLKRAWDWNFKDDFKFDPSKTRSERGRENTFYSR